MPDDLEQLLREAGVGGYELMTHEELLECIQAHDAHHQEHHEREDQYKYLLKQARDALKWEINCEDAITAINKFLGDKSMRATK